MSAEPVDLFALPAIEPDPADIDAYRAELEASDDGLVRARVGYATEAELERLARLGATHRAKVAAGDFGAVVPEGFEPASPELTDEDRAHVDRILEAQDARLRAEQEREAADIRSGTGDAPPAGMIFRTARELFAMVPEATRWALHGLVPRGGIAELDGLAKKAGKTSMAAALVRAVLDGAPFLGRTTERGPVVLLSEQPPASLRATLAPWGLVDRDDLWILTWGDAIGRPWRNVAAEALRVADAAGAVLLVVDTLPQWAGLRGDAENDAGAALEALVPLQRAAAAGLAVLIVRHDRKGSGEVGESARGSTAFGGAVDVIMQLRRGGPDERPTIRYLSALSRFPETPGELVVDRTDDGYQVIGDAAGYARAEAKRKILEAIADRELRRADVEEVAGVSGERLTEALADLVGAGYLERTGRGVKGDPQRFRRIVPIHSGGAPTTWPPPRGMNSGPTAARDAADDELLDRYAGELEDQT